MAKAKVGFKIPKTAGACADRLYELKRLKSEAQKVVDAIDEEFAAIKEHIINTLPKSEASGVAGKTARVSVVVKDVCQVENWDEVWKYIIKNKAYDLMQRRVADAAVKARWEDGKQVPGVVKFNAVTISLNKL